MTIEEGRRIFDELIRQARNPPPSQRYSIEMDDEYMAERDWLKKAFMSTYLDGTEQIDDLHPRIRAHYMGHWPKPQGECSRVSRRRTYDTRIADWAREQCTPPKEPAELTAGDTSQLDDFLCGFVKQEV